MGKMYYKLMAASGSFIKFGELIPFFLLPSLSPFIVFLFLEFASEFQQFKSYTPERRANFIRIFLLFSNLRGEMKA